MGFVFVDENFFHLPHGLVSLENTGLVSKRKRIKQKRAPKNYFYTTQLDLTQHSRNLEELNYTSPPKMGQRSTMTSLN